MTGRKLLDASFDFAQNLLEGRSKVFRLPCGYRFSH
jgi:hypothetical protein